jgi:CRISPR-associated protein Csb1
LTFIKTGKTTMTRQFGYKDLSAALRGHAAALRCVTEYQPAGGIGDKVFPPTYEGGRYATETRVLEGGEIAECVLLDSVQSQANRMELALLEAHRANRTQLPLLVARFDQDTLIKKFSITSLEAPHRAADAIFRDSLYGEMIFRRSEKGRILDTADARSATGLFGLCPTALLFGLWDSTGPRGGLGAKFQRAIVSEMVGISASAGVKTSSRIDPAQVMLGAGPLYSRKNDIDAAPEWTLDAGNGAKKLGKDGKPSEANHGNVTPGITDGGFTVAVAKQTTVISLTALRRLRFPLGGKSESNVEVDTAARTVLAALGLAAASLTRDDSADLRSRCHLIATSAPTWELIDKPGQEPTRFQISGEEALALLNESVTTAKAADLPWEGEIDLRPSDDLVELVRRSQRLATESVGEA